MSESIIIVHGGASGFEREQTLIRCGFSNGHAMTFIYIAIDSEWQPE